MQHKHVVYHRQLWSLGRQGYNPREFAQNLERIQGSGSSEADHFEDDEAEEAEEDEKEEVIHEDEEARGTVVPLLALGLAGLVQRFQFRHCRQPRELKLADLRRVGALQDLVSLSLSLSVCRHESIVWVSRGFYSRGRLWASFGPFVVGL
ncbi:hypothetical protein CRG98_047531 [Punica granatum]|uniref:Uncharacterized protein n=1 Tax=Punica granatum TaxID=22663 RepID=A0A2I0HK15_PUNGR|nr:hypothetical protein CRG98_047531 [Punica granatum]